MTAHPRPPVLIDVGAGERFEFQLPGSDRVWGLPHMDDLPLGIRQQLAETARPVERARAQGKEPSKKALEAFGRTQIRLLESQAPGLSDAASPAALAAILQAWAEHSGIGLGE